MIGEAELRERLERLLDAPVEADWTDVRRRTRRGALAGRRLGVAGLLAAAALVLVATALAGVAVERWTAGGPDALGSFFRGLGAPPSGAHRAAAFRIGGSDVEIWTAHAPGGRELVALRLARARVLGGGGVPAPGSMSYGSVCCLSHGEAVTYGRVAGSDARLLLVRYRDGRVQRVRLQGGWFAFGVPARRRLPGFGVAQLVAFDAKGVAVRNERVGEAATGGVQTGSLRVVAAARDALGVRITLARGRSHAGTACFALERRSAVRSVCDYGPGQTVPVRLRIAAWRAGGHAAAALWGEARPDVARVVVHFEDGHRETVRPRAAGLLFAPTARELLPGHRPEHATVYNDAGRPLLRLSLDAQHRWP